MIASPTEVAMRKPPAAAFNYWHLQASRTSRLRISPGSHSTSTSNGRQHTSQSVVRRWLAVLVSITRSKLWPQNGHLIVSLSSMLSRVGDSCVGGYYPVGWHAPYANGNR